MVINEFLLNGPIEPFHVGVHLRRLRVGVVMHKVPSPEFFVELFLELRAVVGQHERHAVRKYLPTEIKELFCGE